MFPSSLKQLIDKAQNKERAPEIPNITLYLNEGSILTLYYTSVKEHTVPLMQQFEERLIHTKVSHVTSCDRFKTNLCREVVEFTIFP